MVRNGETCSDVLDMVSEANGSSHRYSNDDCGFGVGGQSNVEREHSTVKYSRRNSSFRHSKHNELYAFPNAISFASEIFNRSA